MKALAELKIARELPPAESSVEVSEQYTRWLATHHYENFSIASRLLPNRLRQHFYNIYAYCRWADDLADEVADPHEALELLDWWEEELLNCFSQRATHPVFIALRGTIQEFDIPEYPFLALLSAFRQDQIVHRYETWASVIDYCRGSANPVGHLVLYLYGHRDAHRQRLSDFTCTALQLANFWQDVSRDLDKDRIYIPSDMLRACDLAQADIVARRFDDRYIRLMRALIEKTREMFHAGRPLIDMVDADFRIDLELFNRGGLAVLDAIESVGYNTLAQRPAIGTFKKFQLAGRAIGVHLLLRMAGRVR